MDKEFYQMGEFHGDTVSFAPLDELLEEQDRGSSGCVDCSMLRLKHKFRSMDLESLFIRYCTQLRKSLVGMLCLVGFIQVAARLAVCIFVDEVSKYIFIFMSVYI